MIPALKWLRITTAGLAAGLFAGFGMVFMAASGDLPTRIDGLMLYGVGVIAATIANATGMGGGIVFLPAFEFLSTGGHIAVVASQIVGMSFVIQSFGMTVGSLRWLNLIFGKGEQETNHTTFTRLLVLVLAGSLPTLLLTQQYVSSPPELVLYAFKALSIALGLLVLITTWAAHGKMRDRTTPEVTDYAAIALLSIIGGGMTAFFSVGTGELVALYLFVRQFPLIMTAAIAVIASAANVLVGVWDHIAVGDLPWEALLFVIPGAITGAYVARGFALMLGSIRLKVFAASWITLSSAYLLWAT